MSIFVIILLVQEYNAFELTKSEKNIQFKHYNETFIYNYKMNDFFENEQEETKENFPYIVNIIETYIIIFITVQYE